ncbi:MAG: phospho-sugar mutase [Proteobacteria bacterium]|nr:MAG: phospho-sugar mutase [Pseudomonadota bacterium]
MKHIFREYDIRGIFNQDLNEKSVKTIAYLLGLKIRQKGEVVAIGYDARVHSVQISKWLTSGLNKAGLKVLNMGLVPTPCNYFAGFNDENVKATIMITGSHNPPEYNGLKITIDKLPFFGKDIQALGDEVLAQMETSQIKDDFTCEMVDTLGFYVDFISEHFVHLKGLKERFVIDCGNGAAGEAVSRVCEKLNLDAKILYANPDGTFPNHHPDPSEEKNLQDIKNELKSGKFKLGFAFDGDGDRLGVLSSKHVFKGDEMALLYAKLIKEPKILGEVKCSQMMYDEIDKIGKSHMYKTGHSNIKMKMHEIDIDLAIEVSGHLFFNDRYFGYDDAIYAMFRAIELVKEGVDFDGELAKYPKTYSTDELKIKTTDEEKFEIIKKLKSYLQHPGKEFPKVRDIVDVDGVRVIFENGWGLVRASNTTPTLVARFEATNEDDMRLYQSELNKALEKCR